MSVWIGVCNGNNLASAEWTLYKLESAIAMGFLYAVRLATLPSAINLASSNMLPGEDAKKGIYNAMVRHCRCIDNYGNDEEPSVELEQEALAEIAK